MEKGDFDQCLECGATKHWSKYTTGWKSRIECSRMICNLLNQFVWMGICKAVIRHNEVGPKYLFKKKFQIFKKFSFFHFLLFKVSIQCN